MKECMSAYCIPLSKAERGFPKMLHLCFNIKNWFQCHSQLIHWPTADVEDSHTDSSNVTINTDKSKIATRMPYQYKKNNRRKIK